jgi:hypothetical protein
MAALAILELSGSVTIGCGFAQIVITNGNIRMLQVLRHGRCSCR